MQKNFIHVVKELKMEEKKLTDDLKCNSSHRTSWKQKFFKAKAEIERLTEEKSFATRKMMESKAKAVELQKQVDELKERVNLYETNATNMQFVKYYTKQAIKEMSKEIYEELKNEIISVDIPHGGDPSEENCEAVLWWEIEKILTKGVEKQ